MTDIRTLITYEDVTYQGLKATVKTNDIIYDPSVVYACLNLEAENNERISLTSNTLSHEETTHTTDSGYSHHLSGTAFGMDWIIRIMHVFGANWLSLPGKSCYVLYPEDWDITDPDNDFHSDLLCEAAGLASTDGKNVLIFEDHRNLFE